MKRRGVSKMAKINEFDIVDQNAQSKVGKFTFWNGDVYDGEYKINYDRLLLLKQGNISWDIAHFWNSVNWITCVGRGTYTTDNFDTYHGEWDDDTFSNTDIHIK